MKPCKICGHRTAGQRKIHPQVCGPCLYGKPVGWWDDLPTVLEKLGAVPKGFVLKLSNKKDE